MFAATVGVDLQAKMLNIDNRIVALQLWDTVRINLIFCVYYIIIYFIIFRLVKKGLQCLI